MASEEKRKVRADLHNHLRTYSAMREGDFDRAVRACSRRLGAGGILGIVNFLDRRYEDLTAHASRYERAEFGNAVYLPDKDVLVVKGEEVATAQGHVLLVGYPRNSFPAHGRTLDDTIKDAHDNNAIVIADHPFHRDGLGNYLRNNPDPLVDFDAIEIYNSEAEFSLFGRYPKANENAWEFYKEIAPKYPRLGAVASTDGHSFFEIARAWTEFYLPPYDALRSSEDVIELLRQGILSTRENLITQQHPSCLGACLHVAALSPLLARQALKQAATRFLRKTPCH